MTFTYELCKGRREDEVEGVGIGQLLPGNHHKHRKEETRLRSYCQLFDVTAT